MNVILLSISIVLLVFYMLYLARRKDIDQLKTLPHTQTLPRSKYELALRELSEFKTLPKPKSKQGLVEHNSEQFYLERRLYQIQQETEKEQKSYYLACKERDISWKDYKEYFDSLSILEKFIIPGKISELIVLRNLYLESEKKVDLEINKFSARTRVRLHEELVKKQREEEIERKTLSMSTQDSNTEPESDNPDTQATEASNEHAHLNSSTIESASTKEFQTPQSAENSQMPSASGKALKGVKHFAQEDFNSKFPDFNGLTFIDEQFSIAELEIPLVQDANFDQTYFVSVTFNGRHQYKNCSFKGTDFSYSKWQKPEIPHRFLSCDFTGAKFNFSRLDFIAFYNCIFDLADFQDANLQLIKFVNCRFKNSNITNVDFSKTVMSADMLKAIDFSLSISPPKNAGQESRENDTPNTAENGEKPLEPQTDEHA